MAAYTGKIIFLLCVRAPAVFTPFPRRRLPRLRRQWPAGTEQDHLLNVSWKSRQFSFATTASGRCPSSSHKSKRDGLPDGAALLRDLHSKSLVSTSARTLPTSVPHPWPNKAACTLLCDVHYERWEGKMFRATLSSKDRASVLCETRAITSRRHATLVPMIESQWSGRAIFRRLQ